MTFISFEEAGIKLSATALKERGQYKAACPKCSSTSKHKGKKDLSINVEKGMFRCWNPGCNFIGSIKPEKAVKTYSRPTPIKPPSQLDTQWVQFFAERGISQTTLRKMGVLTYRGKEKTAVVFPFFIDGNLIFYKYRFMDKSFMTSKEAEMVFYNLDSIKGKSEVIITEGEIDCITWVENGLDSKYGIISVPNGANIKGGDLEYFDKAAKKLSHVERFYIAVDDDEAGEVLKEELCRRIGKDKCLIVKYLHGDKSFKDVNDLHKSISDEDNRKLIISDCLKNAIPYPVEGVVSLDDAWDDFMEIYERDNVRTGDEIGISNFDKLCSFEKNYGIHLVAGPPNVAKSDILFNIAVRLAAFYDRKFLIFSPETGKPADIYKALFQIYSNIQLSKKTISQQELVSMKEWIKSHFWIVNDLELKKMSYKSFMEISKKMIFDYGITDIIADPLNAFMDMFTGSGDTMSVHLTNVYTEWQHFSKMYGCPLFFGCHSKAFDTSQDMKIFDMYGGSANMNKADVVIFVRRLYEADERIREERKRNGVGDRIKLQVKKVKKRENGAVGEATMEYNILTGVIDETIQFKSVRQINIEKQISKQYEEDVPF